MEIVTIALGLSVLGAVISVASFVLSRKDKAVKDTKENNIELIKYRLDGLDRNVEKILAKLDNYDNEIRKIVKEEIDKHILEYHKK